MKLKDFKLNKEPGIYLAYCERDYGTGEWYIKDYTLCWWDTEDVNSPKFLLDAKQKINKKDDGLLRRMYFRIEVSHDKEDETVEKKLMSLERYL